MSRTGNYAKNIEWLLMGQSRIDRYIRREYLKHNRQVRKNKIDKANICS